MILTSTKRWISTAAVKIVTFHTSSARVLKNHLKNLWNSAGLSVKMSPKNPVKNRLGFLQLLFLGLEVTQKHGWTLRSSNGRSVGPQGPQGSGLLSHGGTPHGSYRWMVGFMKILRSQSKIRMMIWGSTMTQDSAPNARARCSWRYSFMDPRLTFVSNLKASSRSSDRSAAS